MDFLLNPGLLWASIIGGTLGWLAILRINWPRLSAHGPEALFSFLAAIHVFRYIGLVALVPTHFDAADFGFSAAYLNQVAYGDFAAGLLAVLAIFATLGKWKRASLIRWAFVIIGTLDTLNAGPNFALNIVDQNKVEALGWLILTVYVPALVVTEIALILWLLKKPFQKATA